MAHVLDYDKVNKIITVPTSYGTEISIQELLNDIRDFEDELTSLDIPYITSCAGKEDLGGGVSVGLTLTLLNDWQLAFEARSGPAYIQCKVSGGNIVADNVNGSIYPTAFTQVLITASSSATTADLDAIQYSSYGGVVSVDAINGTAGTAYPIGNQEYPVDNLADAVIIANSKGFNTFSINESMTLSTETVSKMEIVGRNHINTEITIDTSLVCNACSISGCKLDGVLDGGTEIRECIINDLDYVNGHIHDSGLSGTISLAGAKDAFIANCKQIDVDLNPTIDMGGSGQDLVMTDYTGIINIKNLTGSNMAGIGISGGRIVLDSATVTAGIIHASGTGKLLDDSGQHIASGTWNGGVTIINELIDSDTISKNSHIFVDTVNGVSGTTYPTGSRDIPTNNLADALTIAELYNIEKIHVDGALTIDGEDITGFTLDSDRSLGNVITITSMVNTGTCYFQDLTVSGALSGAQRFTTCVLGALTGFDGGAKDSLLTGDITITGTGANYFTNCDTYVTDSTYKSISVGANLLNIIRCRGSFEIADYTGSSSLALDFTAGNCKIASTCVSGVIVVSGLTSLTDESGAGCFVVDGTITERGITDKVWDELAVDHTDAGSMGKAVSDAGSSGNPWATPVSGNTTAGTFGELVGKKVLTLSKWLGLK